MYLDSDGRRFSESFGHVRDLEIGKGFIWGISFERKGYQCERYDN
jgi:hypothetical protein